MLLLVLKVGDFFLDILWLWNSASLLFSFENKERLPYKKISHSYDLEYGSAVIEIHEDAVKPGQNVLIHDDLLATGGSADAAAELIKKCGGSVFGFNFLVALDFLKGEQKLNNHSSNIINLVRY